MSNKPANISISTDSNGVTTARYCGKSMWDHGEVRKEGQIYLGKVIDLEKMIFFKSGLGYYVFNPEDKSCRDLGKDDVPISPPLDKRERKPNVIVTFGGCYFLNTLINGIEYNKVLDSFDIKNRDMPDALLQYYVLCDTSECICKASISKSKPV